VDGHDHLTARGLPTKLIPGFFYESLGCECGASARINKYGQKGESKEKKDWSVHTHL
jgi:hypothetical protein